MYKNGGGQAVHPNGNGGVGEGVSVTDPMCYIHKYILNKQKSTSEIQVNLP